MCKNVHLCLYYNHRGSLIGSTFHSIEHYVGLGEARIWGVRGSDVRLRMTPLHTVDPMKRSAFLLADTIFFLRLAQKSWKFGNQRLTHD